jgi:DNA-binding NarL/FixJ family response regulator
MANKHEVLELASKGFGPNEIAAKLNCHPAYVRATFQRAGLSNTWREHRALKIEVMIKMCERKIKTFKKELERIKSGAVQ